jgi:NADPH-dependent 2,4-dienoyl-CoA reductase/sulfur reductase-like enzyme
VQLSPLKRIVVVGASLAGVRTAQALRSRGYEGDLVLLGDEQCVPYDRPPLSKGYLEGKRTAEQLSLNPANPSLSELGADLRLGTAVVKLDIGQQAVALSDGTSVGFDGLVIATGTRVRSLPGAAPDPRIHYLRTQQDADRLRPLLVPGVRLVVIGAGFIGAEVASTARTLGAQVTVVEAMPIPLSRQLGDQMGPAIGALHEANGTALLCGVSVASLDESGVLLSTGEHLPADVIVVGIGVQPNTEWLTDNGMDLANGVLCDESLQVSIDGKAASGVVAVGDVARWTNPRYPYVGAVRVEHWTSAVETADHAAATLLGNPQPFAPVPYFWSDQYGKKIQFLGRTEEFDEVQVVAGRVDDKFLALYRRGDRLVAALGVSQIKAVMGYRQRLLDGCLWDDALAAVPH